MDQRCTDQSDQDAIFTGPQRGALDLLIQHKNGLRRSLGGVSISNSLACQMDLFGDLPPPVPVPNSGTVPKTLSKSLSTLPVYLQLLQSLTVSLQ